MSGATTLPPPRTVDELDAASDDLFVLLGDKAIGLGLGNGASPR